MSRSSPCETCDVFDVEIAIHGPRQLRQLVEKVREAVERGALRCRDLEPVRVPTAQPPFAELDLEGVTPDVIHYEFECSSCGSVFRLAVETFHGQGGRWSKG